MLSEMPLEWRSRVAEVIGLRGQWETVTKLQDFLVSVPEDSIVPSRDKWFACLEDFEPRDTKVIILGQDPYPTKADAVGVSFAVAKGAQIPRSLVNVMKVARWSLDQEFAKERQWPMDRTLLNWRRQGVLMLNVRLTTEVGKRNAHARKGWEAITRAIMEVACSESRHVVSLLWGNDAHKMAEDLRSWGSELLQSSHPSPLGWTKSGSHGAFRESLCFYHVNERRKMLGMERIAWEAE